MKEINFVDETQLTRNDEDFLCTEVDGETVIMNIKTGNYFGLNDISTDIWKYMDKPIAFKDLISKIMSEYKVDKKTCENDTTALLFQLVKFKVITMS